MGESDEVMRGQRSWQEKDKQRSQEAMGGLRRSEVRYQRRSEKRRIG